VPRSPGVVPLLSLSLLAACSGSSTRTAAPTGDDASGPLFEQVSALDRQVFAAFNGCADPEQLQRHAEFFSDAVEFYHDQGGVTWDRAAMLANTRKYACGNYTRELVPGTLRVHPIKDFGALAQGVHRFCQTRSGTCEGAADFLMVWQRQGDTWRITRVFSYGHRPL
jgi:hypothetical protein